MSQTRNLDEKWLIVGATGGLGRALLRQLFALAEGPSLNRAGSGASTGSQLVPSAFLLTSRRADRLASLLSEFSTLGEPRDQAITQWIGDLTDSEAIASLVNLAREFGPHRILFLAGGGPFGRFASKEWKDHEWAWRLSFAAPARLIHEALRGALGSQLRQFIVIGSAIAECRPDINAASYAAAKHALRGLIATVQTEEDQLDLRLCSPGYMDTPMLPPNAPPRSLAGRVMPPGVVASDLLSWMVDTSCRNQNRTIESGF